MCYKKFDRHNLAFVGYKWSLKVVMNFGKISLRIALVFLIIQQFPLKHFSLLRKKN